jgi:hypothetical protein
LKEIEEEFHLECRFHPKVYALALTEKRTTIEKPFANLLDEPATRSSFVVRAFCRSGISVKPQPP